MLTTLQVQIFSFYPFPKETYLIPIEVWEWLKSHVHQLTNSCDPGVCQAISKLLLRNVENYFLQCHTWEIYAVNIKFIILYETEIRTGYGVAKVDLSDCWWSIKSGGMGRKELVGADYDYAWRSVQDHQKVSMSRASNKHKWYWSESLN